jgi:hypothetical protein
LEKNSLWVNWFGSKGTETFLLDENAIPKHTQFLTDVLKLNLTCKQMQEASIT